MSLVRCPTCILPLSMCVCALLVEVRSRVPIVVVRHVFEAKKASNTGVLAARVVGGRVVDHGLPHVAADLGDLGSAPHLLFPQGAAREWPEPSALVVLDGTWSQARTMRSRVAGVAGLPTLSLEAPEARVRLRAQVERPTGMSTIEAIAGALERLDDPEPAAALRRLYEAMSERWLWLRQHPSVRG